MPRKVALVRGYARGPPAVEEEKQMSRSGKLTLEMAVVFCLVSTTAVAQQTKDVPSIIDVHLHALHANSRADAVSGQRLSLTSQSTK